MYRSAYANIANNSLQFGEWKNFFSRGKSKIRLSSKAEEALASDQYLLTHCTLVASVDVENGPNKVEFPDYHITSGTEQYINGNADAFERKLLANEYTSLINADNFVEHCQLKPLSKGFVVDAISRDTGDSLYTDILLATNRKFADLCRKIEAGEVNSLSMGAEVGFSLCSICGHNANLDGTSEPNFCEHVANLKGSEVYASGRNRIVAELLGHHTRKGSVRFMDASWVMVPAFKGAVVHKIVASSMGMTGAKTLSLANMGLKKVASNNRPRSLQVGDSVKTIAFNEDQPDMPIGVMYLVVSINEDGSFDLIDPKGTEYKSIASDKIVPVWGSGVRNFLWPDESFSHWGSKLRTAVYFGAYGLVLTGSTFEEASKIVAYVDQRGLDNRRQATRLFYDDLQRHGLSDRLFVKHTHFASKLGMCGRCKSRIDDLEKAYTQLL